MWEALLTQSPYPGALTGQEGLEGSQLPLTTLQLGTPSLLAEKLSSRIRVRYFSSSFTAEATDMSATVSTDLEKRSLRTSWLC